MEKKRATSKFSLCKRLLVAAMVLAMTLTVFLSGATALAASDMNSNVIEFDKYLILKDDANVPKVTFGFTISHGEAQNATATSPRIEAGIGSPVISSAVFAPSDTPITTAVQGIPLGQNEQYVKKTVSIDFSNVAFTAPGIYRYIVTEGASSVNGITNDANASRILDVYVIYDTSASSTPSLKIAGSVMYKETESSTLEKSRMFVNTYSTNNVTLKKEVTGNQGDRNKDFTFTVTIQGNPGNVYSVLQGNNTVDLTMNQNGTASGTFNLKHDGSIVIQGLATGDTFAIEENDYSNESYNTSYKLNGATTATTGRSLSATTMGDGAQSVVFINNREGSVPTGILMEFEPYLILGAVVMASFLLLYVPGKIRRSR